MRPENDTYHVRCFVEKDGRVWASVTHYIETGEDKYGLAWWTEDGYIFMDGDISFEDAGYYGEDWDNVRSSVQISAEQFDKITYPYRDIPEKINEYAAAHRVPMKKPYVPGDIFYGYGWGVFKLSEVSDNDATAKGVFCGEYTLGIIREPYYINSHDFKNLYKDTYLVESSVLEFAKEKVKSYSKEVLNAVKALVSPDMYIHL